MGIYVRQSRLRLTLARVAITLLFLGYLTIPYVYPIPGLRQADHISFTLWALVVYYLVAWVAEWRLRSKRSDFSYLWAALLIVLLLVFFDCSTHLIVGASVAMIGYWAVTGIIAFAVHSGLLSRLLLRIAPSPSHVHRDAKADQ